MKKILKLLLILVIIVVVGIACYFFGLKNQKWGSISSVSNQNEQQAETVSRNLEVEIKKTDSWRDETNSLCTQYDVKIKNIVELTVSDWMVKLIDVPQDMQFVRYWNTIEQSDGSTIEFKPESYNSSLNANEQLTFGFIIKSESELNCDNYEVYIDGKLDNGAGSEEESSQIEESQIAEKDDVMDNFVEKHGKLSVAGKKIVDEHGKIYQLKGISTHNIAEYPQYVNEETFKDLKENWGINCIRIAMYSNPADGYTTDLHTTVKSAINYATDLGLYVIVDWHILQDNNPNIYKTEAIAFFNEIAAEYKDNKNILYEICNEPNGSTSWENDIKPYAEEVIASIRAIDEDSIIIVGTPTWSQDVDAVANNPIVDYSNIMYTLHFYAGSHKEELRAKLKTALNKGLPVFVTEFGISNADGNGTVDEDEGNTWISFLNENNISWVCWNLSNKNESSALIDSTCSKLFGFTDEELTTEGRWLKSKLAE